MRFFFHSNICASSRPANVEDTPCESHIPSRDGAHPRRATNRHTPVREVQYLLMQNHQGALLLQCAQLVQQAIALPVSCIVR